LPERGPACQLAVLRSSGGLSDRGWGSGWQVERGAGRRRVPKRTGFRRVGQCVFIARHRVHVLAGFVGISTGPAALAEGPGWRGVPCADMEQDLLSHTRVINDRYDTRGVLAEGTALRLHMPDAQNQVARTPGRERERGAAERRPGGQPPVREAVRGGAHRAFCWSTSRSSEPSGCFCRGYAG
jgi:hypothetical protein